MLINQRKEYSKIWLLLLASLFYCCSEHKKQIVKGEEYDREGVFINDSVPHGLIRFYKANSSNLVATENYKYGVLHGPSLNYHQGNLIQKSVFVNGLKEGYSEIFDSITSNLKFKRFYHHGKHMGHSLEYDEQGAVKGYFFRSFDNSKLFEFYADSGKNEYSYSSIENLENFTLSEILINNEFKINFFTYLIYPPRFFVEYKIKLIDSSGEIRDSIVLSRSKVFEELPLPYPNDVVKPVFEINVYDSIRQKRTFIINHIEIRE